MAMLKPIQTNPATKLTVTRVGSELADIIVSDDFLMDPAQIIGYAQNADFGQDATSVYPGVRAPLPDACAQPIIDTIVPVLRDVYTIPDECTPRHIAFLSLVATPPERLKIMQRLPHFDSKNPLFFAVTLYLSPGEFAGTGLFRHRPTGFESISEDRFADYSATGESFLRRHGEPPAAYTNATTDHYELYHTIDYRPNRLVAYRGWVLHSGLVDPERDISADPVTGRLTANLFLEFS